MRHGMNERLCAGFSALVAIGLILALAACGGGSGDSPSGPDPATSPGTPNTAPSASFTVKPASGTAPLAVTLDASASEDSDGSISRYRWEFGDGATGEGRSMQHTYSEAGSYTVRLTVTDNDGATATAQQNVQVEQNAQGTGLLMPIRTATCEQLYRRLSDAEGAELVALVRGGNLRCITDLQWTEDRSLQVAVSREQNAVTVAEAVPLVMENYDGAGAHGVKQMFLYLRMVKDIHFWCRTRKQCSGEEFESVAAWPVGSGSPAYEAVKSGADSFIDHPEFFGYGEDHGDSLWEFANVVIDWGMEEVYLSVVADWLNAWDDRHASIPIYRDAMIVILGISFQGHRRPGEFGPVFGADEALMHAFRDFVLEERWLGTSSQRLVELSVLELARFTAYPGTPNYDAVIPVFDSIRNAYENHVRGEGLWLRVVAQINHDDPGNCSRYDLCEWYAGEGFHANFRAVLFKNALRCLGTAGPGDSIRVMSQDLTPDELDTACRRLFDHAEYFHELFETNYTPVRDDFNDHLEIFVFRDGDSCEDFESGAFGGYPDSCSGIYFEGDPSDRDNMAQMIVTEYTPDENPRDPELAVWNFEHEFGHYLDGRFNRHGGYRGADDSIHWWTEGFAEYFAAETSPYIRLPAFRTSFSLSEILLHSDSLPTPYADRHLAVRFFMDNHRDFIDTLLGFTRAGNWDAYTSHLTSEAPKYEAEFRSWLDQGRSAESTAAE